MSPGMKMQKPSAREISRFRREILDFYKENGRDFPWRRTRDPYAILVSEIMLQQTQADRVIPKFIEFMLAFPTVRSLSRAPLARIFRVWQGLGYNRRAVALKRAAGEILKRFGGKVPREVADLISLPGVGPYTASAIRAFAFNEPDVFIETNIRSVYITRFFPRRKKVEDAELIPLIEATQDAVNPRRWYSALMDYGNMLKREGTNPSRRSSTYVRQRPFRNSNREFRGKLLRFATGRERFTPREAARETQKKTETVEVCLRELVREGFIVPSGSGFSIAK